MHSAIVLFDGVCNLCNASVQYILDHDRDAYFRFASLQSPAAKELLSALGHVPLAPGSDPQSLILVESDQVYESSTAALRIARHLTGASRLLAIFLLVPRPLRDLVYRFVARHRYRWFGRTAECRLPSPETAARFL